MPSYKLRKVNGEWIGCLGGTEIARGRDFNQVAEKSAAVAAAEDEYDRTVYKHGARG